MGYPTINISFITQEKLERFNLKEFFELVLIDTEVGFSKPDIKIYELALNKLSLQSDDVWMIGDNLVWDIELIIIDRRGVVS